MHDYIERTISANAIADMQIFPAVAILGSRQAGKPRVSHIGSYPQGKDTNPCGLAKYVQTTKRMRFAISQKNSRDQSES